MNRVIRIEHQNPAGSMHTLIECKLGNKCNYECSYCPAHLHDGSIGWFPYEKLTAFFDKAEAHYSQHGKTLMLQYTGGEPTVHPRFRDLVKRGHERGYLQSVLSNASRTLRFWESVRSYFTLTILTYHQEFADPEHYLDVVRCVSETTHVHCNLTMIPSIFYKNLALATQLWEIPNVSVLLKPLRDANGNIYNYAPEQKRIMAQQQGASRVETPGWPQYRMKTVYEDGTEEHTNLAELALHKSANWKGWECAAGMEQLTVTVEGDVFVGKCRVGGPLGNILTDVEFPDKNVICTRDACWCITDMLSTKTRKD